MAGDRSGSGGYPADAGGFVVKEISEDSELMRLLYVAGFEFPSSKSMFREHLGPICC